MTSATDIIDLPELAERQGWTIDTAREMVRRANRRRAAGQHLRLSDPPPPLRLVADRSPIWARATIERWEAMREESRIESQPDDPPAAVCKQCGDPVRRGVSECGACAFGTHLGGGGE